MEKRVRVGVGVFIIKDCKVLLGKRKNAHGEGDWCFPGGHLEFGESWEDCAKRETKEETGIEIENVRFGTVTNDIFPKEDKHYITIILLADWKSGEVKVLEPHKCEKWEWFEWKKEKLPENLFEPQIKLIEQGFDPMKR